MLSEDGPDEMCRTWLRAAVARDGELIRAGEGRGGGGGAARDGGELIRGGEGRRGRWGWNLCVAVRVRLSCSAHTTHSCRARASVWLCSYRAVHTHLTRAGLVLLCGYEAVVQYTHNTLLPHFFLCSPSFSSASAVPSASSSASPRHPCAINLYYAHPSIVQRSLGPSQRHRGHNLRPSTMAA